ncbi:MAG: hypothetical protein A2481_03945 [Candidatus Yonathbacteria bacterium RIFOXYC2_FULL_47_9]|nr:MAG: hypothetical protein A2481_03945 [Candidatus Yonathbacteria bacterium RIFOXYC2_FULL_47_9]
MSFHYTAKKQQSTVDNENLDKKRIRFLLSTHFYLCPLGKTLRYLTLGKPTVFPALPPQANQLIRVLDVN